MSARLYIAPPDRLDAAARRFASDRPDESSPAASARGGVRPSHDQPREGSVARLNIGGAPPAAMDSARRRGDGLAGSSASQGFESPPSHIPMTAGRVRVGGRPAGITVTGEDRVRTVPSYPSSSPPRSLSEAELRRMRADALRREQCMMDERLARDAKVERQLLDRILGGRA